jgi:very-short-patch-repair endonuclease
MRVRQAFSKATRARARQLRQEQTYAESLLWRELRRHRVSGLHIRRQHPIGPYIVDFCCTSRFLVIEVDGAAHLQPEGKAADAVRTEVLGRLGYRVIRFSNEEVENDLGVVLRRIERELSTPPPTPHTHENKACWERKTTKSNPFQQDRT